MTLVKNKETIMLKNVPNLIPPNFLFLGFIYLWLLYPLTAELFPFLPLKNLNAD